MSWVLVLATALAVVAALMVAKTTVVRMVSVVAVLAAAGAYWFIGKPNMGDQPLDRRMAELERRAEGPPENQPDRLDEVMAIWEHRARVKPDDPEPHFRLALLNDIVRQPGKGQMEYQAGLRRDAGLRAKVEELDKRSTSEEAISQMTEGDLLILLEHRAWENPSDPTARIMMGRIYERAGQPQQAQLYFEAAMGRDPNSGAAKAAMAGLIFRATGQFDGQAARLYREAYAQDPSDPSVAIMAALDMWRSGQKAEAEALWAATLAKLPPDDGLRTMYGVIRNQFAPQDGAGQPAPQPPKSP